MTNNFLTWELGPEDLNPAAKQVAIAQHQKEVAADGGVLTNGKAIAV